MRKGNGGGGNRGAAEIRASECFCLGHRWLILLDYVPPAVFSPGDSTTYLLLMLV